MNDSHVVISETKSFDIWKYTEKSLRDNGWNMYSPLYLALCHTFKCCLALRGCELFLHGHGGKQMHDMHA